ncbi:MAG: hypothetical protein NTW25_00505 [Candidatus Kapabacteria bacterium]|nr:hypothetical protein [Candidatus Kapabacteria bacterium]
MPKYKMLGGGIITANSPKEFVQKLREISFNPCESVEEFLEKTAEACNLQNGTLISFENESWFLVDLIKNSFVEEVE